MIKLLNTDCLNVLAKIPDEKIDLIVTDCPYKIVSGGCSIKDKGNEPTGILARRSKKADDDTVKNSRNGKLFNHNDIEFKDWLPDVYRVLKKTTVIATSWLILETYLIFKMNAKRLGLNFKTYWFGIKAT